MRIVAVLTLWLLAAGTSPAEGQQASAETPRPIVLRASDSGARFPVLMSEPMRTAAPRLSDARAQRIAPIDLKRTAFATLIGGWAGYVIGHIVYNDWHESEDGEFSTDRIQFAVGGAVLGLGISALVDRMVGPEQPPILASSGPSRDRNVIDAEEIQSASGATAYDIVQSLRPNWLRTRGQQSWREEATIDAESKTRMMAQPGDPTIIVYLDNAELGAIGALRTIPAGTIAFIRFYTPAQATSRWGAGHTHGAIFVATSAGSTAP